jgi:general stress protein 26
LNFNGKTLVFDLDTAILQSKFMRSYLPLTFIEEKIKQLQTALFFSMSPTILKFAPAVIMPKKVDGQGQVWFSVPPPQQSVKEFDREFLCELQFFRKGMDFYLKIAGKAYIVADPEEINSIDFVDEDFKRGVFEANEVLLKVKIHTADYFARRTKAPKMELKQWLSEAYNYFFEPSYTRIKPHRIVWGNSQYLAQTS